MSEQPEIVDLKARFRCRHIRISGRRCTSPALIGHDFCYYHRVHRNRAPIYFNTDPNHCEFTIPFVLEDRATVQLTLGKILNLLSDGQLDLKRARILIEGLTLAARLLPREDASGTAAPTSNLLDAIEEDIDHNDIAPVEQIPDMQQTPAVEPALEPQPSSAGEVVPAIQAVACSSAAAAAPPGSEVRAAFRQHNHRPDHIDLNSLDAF